MRWTSLSGPFKIIYKIFNSIYGWLFILLLKRFNLFFLSKEQLSVHQCKMCTCQRKINFCFLMKSFFFWQWNQQNNNITSTMAQYGKINTLLHSLLSPKSKKKNFSVLLQNEIVLNRDNHQQQYKELIL